MIMEESVPIRANRRHNRIVAVVILAVVTGWVVIFGWNSYRNTRIHDRQSTAWAEMRNLAVGLESFRQRNGRLPSLREFYTADHEAYAIPSTDPPIQFTLTSPVPHMAAMPGDVFTRDRRSHYHYYTDGKTMWILGTVGPDGKSDFFSGPEGGWKNEKSFVAGTPGARPAGDPRFFCPDSQGGAPGASHSLYDPNNGWHSHGDIIMTGP